MERHYDLRLVPNDDTGVVKVRFWSNEKCELRVIRGKFFFEPKKAVEYPTSLTAIFLDNDWKEYIFAFPEEKHSYTSLNFIIKDETHKTQFAVQLPLDGASPKFSKMLYGE